MLCWLLKRPAKLHTGTMVRLARLTRSTARSRALVFWFLFKTWHERIGRSSLVLQVNMRACFVSVALHSETAKIGHVVACFTHILKSNHIQFTDLFLFLQAVWRKSACDYLPIREMGCSCFAVVCYIISCLVAAQMCRPFAELFIGMQVEKGEGKEWKRRRCL